MNHRSVRSPSSAQLILVTAVLVGCQPSAELSPVESPAPTVASMPSASADPSASTSPSSVATIAPTPSPSAPGGLQVEGFAEVVADRLQMRVAPGLAAEVVVEPLFGDYPPGTPFPPVVIGRELASTLVYLLAGPVVADGFEWYFVAEAEEASIWPGYMGWVAAGDAEDAWLVGTTVACPDEPVELADVTLMAMSRLRAIHCFGGRDITLRGYYVAPPPGEPLEGDCVSEPAWLVCDFGWHGLRTSEAPWAGDANRLELQLHPDLGPMPPRPGWIEVTGQFDHSAAAECGDGRLAGDIGCRMEFVVTSARSVE